MVPASAVATYFRETSCTRSTEGVRKDAGVARVHVAVQIAGAGQCDQCVKALHAAMDRAVVVDGAWHGQGRGEADHTAIASGEEQRAEGLWNWSLIRKACSSLNAARSNMYVEPRVSVRLGCIGPFTIHS